MNDVFGQIYAGAYDTLYQDKDYASECDLIELLFQTYGGDSIHSIVDLGCGTGNHAIILAQQGYEVIGVDRSESMLVQARKKTATLGMNKNKISFEKGDICSIDLQRQADSALMMFAVLGYQLQNADVLSALKTARRHLRRGGLFIFDVWYGPAVLHERPSQRVKVIPTPGGQILRVASGKLDIQCHVCTVDFHVWRLEGERLVAEKEESHSVRYFFPLELTLFLECSGFNLIRLGAFPEFDRNPNEETWDVLGVAKAV